MKDIIKKVLKEESELPDGSDEDRISEIENRKKRIIKLIPKIISFFKIKFKDSLLKIEMGEKGVHYSNERYSTIIPHLDFYFGEIKDPSKVRKQVIMDLNSFFSIDVRYYGVPLDLRFYMIKWKEF